MKKLLSIFALVLLVGCAKPAESPNTLVVYDEPGPAYYVHEMRLKDGTRCVVSTSGSLDGGVAITCEWESRGEVE